MILSLELVLFSLESPPPYGSKCIILTKNNDVDFGVWEYCYDGTTLAFCEAGGELRQYAEDVKMYAVLPDIYIPENHV